MNEGVRDDFAAGVAAQGDDPELVSILHQVCALTGMGFAAIARVTENRWIVAQVLDRIEFGLEPGHELEISTTICNEIRLSGNRVVIDSVGDSEEWQTHPVPIIYGFKSYASFPIRLADESFYGTLCAIDPQPRRIATPAIVTTLEGFAKRAGEILSAGRPI